MKLEWKQYHILNNTSKMKTKVLLFSLMFVMSQQVFGYTIKTDTVVIHYEKYQLEQIIVSINNTDDKPLWIWLD